MTLRPEGEIALEPQGAPFASAPPITTATAVTGAAPLLVVVGPDIRIEVTDLDDGRLPIDNELIERIHRGPP